MWHFLLSLVLILLGTNIAFAQISSNSFFIRTLIVNDFTPPSAPVLLSADPVASTQINLSWSASTDDYGVSGYSVFRDGMPIATTTLLSYSDTGLTASTTYSYFIYAFDVGLNYSTSSNSLSTTTLETPPPSPSPPISNNSSQQGGTIARVVLENFWIESGLSTTSLNVQTAHPARVEVRWGRTNSYELGYVVSDIYRKEHEVLLTDLEPGTTYEYELIGYTPHGKPSVIKAGSFTTLSKITAISPVNVGRFIAIQSGDNVELSWQMPKEENLSHVRVVRSHLGFPEHPQDGAIVYQGNKESTRDEGVLSLYSPVYYTVFVYGTDGSVSSGAIAIVYAREPVTEDYQNDIDSSNVNPATRVPIATDEATSSINTERITIEMKMPKPSDILITQKENSYSLIDPNIVLNNEHDFVVSIPRTTIAGNLKSIIVTILDPTDNKATYSYLLRINQDQTSYNATVPTLGVIGRSQIRVEIFDYEALVVATYQTPLTFSLLTEPSGEIVFPDKIFKNLYFFWSLLFLLIIFIVIIFLVYKRRGEDK